MLAIPIIIALMMKAASTSIPSENVYQTKRRNIPDDSHLQTQNARLCMTVSF
jgi:hypothetical protein